MLDNIFVNEPIQQIREIKQVFLLSDISLVVTRLTFVIKIKLKYTLH
jgi:hypothetical protein